MKSRSICSESCLKVAVQNTQAAEKEKINYDKETKEFIGRTETHV